MVTAVETVPDRASFTTALETAKETLTAASGVVSTGTSPTGRPRQAEHQQVARLRRPVAQPADDGGVSPAEPDADESGLIGGTDDLGAADLGPIAPDAHDPDADSARPRK